MSTLPAAVLWCCAEEVARAGIDAAEWLGPYQHAVATAGRVPLDEVARRLGDAEDRFGITPAQIGRRLVTLPPLAALDLPRLADVDAGTLLYGVALSVKSPPVWSWTQDETTLKVTGPLDERMAGFLAGAMEVGTLLFGQAPTSVTHERRPDGVRFHLPQAHPTAEDEVALATTAADWLRRATARKAAEQGDDADWVAAHHALAARIEDNPTTPVDGASSEFAAPWMAWCRRQTARQGRRG